jgi:hypothetical protein
MTKPQSALRESKVYELRCALLELDPPIWRLVALPADITLNRLHRMLQVLFDWTDSHLHEFVTSDGVRYEPKHPLLEPDPESKDERNRKLPSLLKRPGDTLLYRYDFGDDWQVQIELVRIEEVARPMRHAVCLDGEFAAPPDDCGGVYGYLDLLDAIADPSHPEHEEMVEWLGPGFDPKAFDRDNLNLALNRIGK